MPKENITKVIMTWKDPAAIITAGCLILKPFFYSPFGDYLFPDSPLKNELLNLIQNSKHIMDSE